MPIAALFDINLDGEDSGYEATNEESLSLTLRDPSAASTVLFQVYDPSGPNPTLGIAANPPRASKGAPTLTLVGATSGQAVSPTTGAGAVTCEMPETGGHSWIVRCVVNGGRRSLPNGSSVVDTSLIFERGIYIPASVGLRKVVITERTQFEADGWAGVLADLVDTELGGGIAAGSYVNQPAAWNGSAWAPTTTLQFDVAASRTDATLWLWSLDALDGVRSSVYLGVYAQVQSTGDVNISVVNGALYAQSGIMHSFGSTHEAENVEILRLGLDGGGAPTIGFLGAGRVTRQSITGVTTQEQIDSIVSALVELGLVADDRAP